MNAAAGRGAGFFALWLMLAGTNPGDMAVGAIAAVAATWCSLRLAPPGAWRISALGLARLAVRFPAQSVLAGVDVAWRALHPALPLQPGFVTFPSCMPLGTGRIAFGTLTSLLPGTLPLGPDASGAELIHCLDTRLDVVGQLRAEEALFLAAVPGVRRDG